MNSHAINESVVKYCREIEAVLWPLLDRRSGTFGLKKCVTRAFVWNEYCLTKSLATDR